MILRLVACDIPGCSARHEETTPGEGYPGWGQLHGIVLNGTSNPLLCPKHLAKVADYIDNLKVGGA